MMRQTLPLPVITYLGIMALLVAAAVLVGAPPGSSSEAKKDKSELEAGATSDEQVRREAEQVIRGIDLEVYSDEKWTKVERIEKPLLFYS